jgi:protoporphyrinogen/coproporphyrinogen III oxidase
MNTQPHNTGTAHVVIIGGGITGLSAGWYLQQEAAQQGIDLRYTILEGSPRWGGKVQTETVDTGEDAPFVLEAGPDAFLTRKPWALELARELGLGERLLPVNTENSRIYVLNRGRPVPLPDGLQLLAPTQILPFLRSPLFSPWGKLRALLDLLIPPRLSDDDETLADFVRRRLGAEMLDKLGEPLLGGVFNGDAERQSMLATFPQFPALEKQHGSLIRGLRAAQGRRDDTPPFISFITGTHELVTGLVKQLNGDLCLNTSASRIEPLANNRYRVVINGDGTIEADAMILTTPAPITAKLLREVAPAAVEPLNDIPYSGIGTAYFAFRREDVPHPLHGFGLVVPASEGRSIDGVTWTSSKWKHRAPSGHALLRVFFGGPRTRETLHLDDADLLVVLRAELHAIFGIAVPPLFHRVYRWQDGYPQYNLDHLERVTAIESALPPCIFAAGSAYRGVGVPDCVRQGRDASKRAVAAITGRQ